MPPTHPRSTSPALKTFLNHHSKHTSSRHNTRFHPHLSRSIHHTRMTTMAPTTARTLSFSITVLLLVVVTSLVPMSVNEEGDALMELRQGLIGGAHWVQCHLVECPI